MSIYSCKLYYYAALSGRLCNKQSYDMPSNPTTNLGVVEGERVHITLHAHPNEKCIYVTITYSCTGTSSYEILLYQVSMIVGLALACMFFVLLVIVISCACFCHRKKQKGKLWLQVNEN